MHAPCVLMRFSCPPNPDRQRKLLWAINASNHLRPIRQFYPLILCCSKPKPNTAHKGKRGKRWVGLVPQELPQPFCILWRGCYTRKVILNQYGQPSTRPGCPTTQCNVSTSGWYLLVTMSSRRWAKRSRAQRADRTAGKRNNRFHRNLLYNSPYVHARHLIVWGQGPFIHSRPSQAIFSKISPQ